MRQYNAYSKKKNTLCSEMVGYCGGCCDEVARWRGDGGDYSSLYGRSSTMRVASFQMPMKSPVSELYA